MLFRSPIWYLGSHWKPKPLWSQPKVRRRALIVFLLSVGVIVGVGVGVGVQGGTTQAAVIFVASTPAPSASESPTPAPSAFEPPNFDCSDSSAGCLYTGTDSFGFQNPASFLVANCTDTNFDIPYSENCDCEVNVPSSTNVGFESCQSCLFIASADGGWQLSYDCSNILSGECVGLDAASNCISRVRFETTRELRVAVDEYLADNSTGTAVARTYGWPIGIWDVFKIQGFSELFKVGYNATFNEDISGWKVANATTMRSMFAYATSFNQPIGNWDVSSVKDMASMFDEATSFNQPLTEWNVSSVTTTHSMFQSATSFNQPLADWNVSKVTTMRSMFAHATSFDQPLAEWDVSSVTTMYYMFQSVTCFNQRLADWNVSSVTTMHSMCAHATSFDQPLADWDVSSVTNMRYMFQSATSFTQPLADWNVSSVIYTNYMFHSSGCPGAEGEESCFFYEISAGPSQLISECIPEPERCSQCRTEHWTEF
jgi:surface protein